VVTGPSSIVGNSVTEYEYTAIARGGSSYLWESIGPIEVRTSPDTPYVAFVKATSNDTTKKAFIRVTETTYGGKTGSTSKYYPFMVTPYCSFPGKNFFAGKYTCKDAGLNTSYEVSILTNIPGYTFGGDTLLITNFYEGALEVKVLMTDNPDRKISIKREKQTIAESGTYVLIEVSGEGTYNSCDTSLSMTYSIYVNGEYSPSITGSQTYKYKKPL
jgi:hypothetical protein